MNKLLIILSSIIGLPILVFMVACFLTGGRFRISIENNNTGEEKEFGFNLDKEE